MTQEEKAKAYDEVLKRVSPLYEQAIKDGNPIWSTYEYIIPELSESEDERIYSLIYSSIKNERPIASPRNKELALAYLERQKDASKAIEAVDRIDKYIDEHLANAHDMKDSNPDKKYYRGWDDALGKMAGILQDVYSGEKQKPIKMEVYEAGKSTTICGQDYKCKKDYKKGNCWYIKDVIYHCGRDGYLTDQNGVSWSCTPEWFKEYIQSNAEWAEEEKTRFVSGQFLQCKLSFDDFKEGEHYWLEYVGDDMYVGRSDNILNQKFHITPRQLFTLFSQQLEEVQGPPQEEKQVSLNYEPPFNENPSDIEIIDALIHSLNEQDGFLTAIDCVSTKAILSWLEKQKEQKPAECSEEDEHRRIDAIYFLETAKSHYADTSEIEKTIVWLKSLPLNLKKKNEDVAKLCSNEWSEEEKKFIKHCAELLDEQGEPMCALRLESIRPQYHGDVTMTEAYKMGLEAGKASSWKPSEEQMKALQNAVALTACDKELARLYNQLKKL